ncbi:MAG: hypothetical protein R2883_08570 [Caldisericia bacterium]
MQLQKASAKVKHEPVKLSSVEAYVDDVKSPVKDDPKRYPNHR